MAMCTPSRPFRKQPTIIQDESQKKKKTDKAKFKLHYFNLRSQGEGIRLLFHFAGVDFEDFRFEVSQWTGQDPSIPRNTYKGGQVPILEITEKGKTFQLSQPLTICRYLARRFNMVGKDDLEAALCDEVVDSLFEPFIIALPAFTGSEEKKEEVHKQLVETEYPRVLGRLEQQLKDNGGKNMVGKGWTWADISVAWILQNLKDYVPSTAIGIDRDFPTLVQLAKTVEEHPKLAPYLAGRPYTTR